MKGAAVLSPSSDPRPTPRLLVWCSKGEEPQTIITTAYIPRAKPVMMYSDDARSASSKATRHHGLRAQEQMAGDDWWEMDRPVAFRHTDPDNKELKFKDRVFKR